VEWIRFVRIVTPALPKRPSPSPVRPAEADCSPFPKLSLILVAQRDKSTAAESFCLRDMPWAELFLPDKSRRKGRAGRDLRTKALLKPEACAPRSPVRRSY
jgi:hypothetical protein